MANRKIMFVGASGTGKTTLAKIIAGEWGIPFVNGSSSVLVPSTKDLHQSSMMSAPLNDLLDIENSILVNRMRAVEGFDNYISDRSFIDNMVYSLLKLSSKVDHVYMHTFLDHCKKYLAENCTHLIFLGYTQEMMHTWGVEENGKRVTNPYFQWMVSGIMGDVLVSLDFNMYEYNETSMVGDIKVWGKTIKVLNMEETDKEKRLAIIRTFLNE